MSSVPTRFLAAPAIPRMSSELQSSVEDIRRGGAYFPPAYDGDTGFRMPPEPVRYNREAESVLHSIEQCCLPLDKHLVTAWVAKLATGSKQPPPQNELMARIAGICTACAEIPLTCWSDETLAEALQTFAWFPSAAEVFGLLKPHADLATGTRNALRRIVDAKHAGPSLLLGYAATEPAGSPTEAERQHVAAVVTAFVSEREDSDKIGDRPKARPFTLSDTRLLREYEKVMEENPPTEPAYSVAAFRANWLRKKLGMRLDKNA